MECKKLRKIVINVVLIIISCIISQIICYEILDDIIVFITIKRVFFIVPRILLALSIFILIKSINNKKIDRRSVDILGVLYILFILGATLFKSSAGGTGVININPLEIINDFKNTSNAGRFLIFNILIYIPVGIYINYKFFNWKTRIKVIIFVCYIFCVEIVQHITQLGVCDINDIILNTIGFSIGVYLQKGMRILIKKIRGNIS